MNSSAFKHVLVAVAGGAVAGVVLLGVLALLNRSAGFASCTAMADYGWIAPLLAGLIIGGVALLLLESSPAEQPTTDSSSVSAACASCGNQIVDEWRLCPHCGELLECDTGMPSLTNIRNI